jgi:methylmalonyl-CoA mutase
MSEKIFIIPPSRTRYLSEIIENNRKYDKWAARTKASIAQKLFSISNDYRNAAGNERLKTRTGSIKTLQEVYHQN